MKYSAQIAVTLKPGVPDAPGRGILATLRSLGIADGVIAIRAGKVISLDINHRTPGVEIDEVVDDMCHQLLVHTAIEECTYRLTAHAVQADGAVIKMPLSRWTPYNVISELFFAPKPHVWQVDLQGKWPAIGPYRILRAEWWRWGSRYFAIRYAKDDVEQPVAWMLDTQARVFNDSKVDEIGKTRVKALQKIAPEMVDYVVRYVRVFKPEPVELDA
jgi:phosphoribosylformylglycinamidine synthase PurS subunit